jgi:electron transfer flavoprotein alpha subunit
MSCKILVVAEHDGSKLNASTAKAVTCASKVPGATVDVAVLAADASALGAQAAALAGVNKVIVAENPANQEAVAAIYAPRLATRTCSGPRRRSERTSCRVSRPCSA